MKRIIFLIPVAFALVLFFVCRPVPYKTVELTVSGAQGRALALFEISEDKGAVFLDSVYPAKRHQTQFSFPCKDLHIYTLFAPGCKESLVLLPVENEPLCLCTNYDSLVSGAKLCGKADRAVNRDVLNYQKRVLQTECQIEAIEQNWLSGRYTVTNADSLYAACSRSIDSLFSNLRQEAIQLCQQHTDNLLPVFIANKTVGKRTIFDMNNSGDIIFLKNCADALVKNLPFSGHAARLLFNAERAESRLKQRHFFDEIR